jgi:N utilization substance protein A
LVEIVGAEAMDEEAANAVIMAARAHWFEDGDAAPADKDGADESGEAGDA